MKLNTIEDVFLDQIRGLYDVEKQLVRALPKMAKAAESEELAEGLRSHLVETNEHVSRLEQIFDLCGETPKARALQDVARADRGIEAGSRDEGSHSGSDDHSRRSGSRAY